jgi:hypothetical protein
LKKFIPLIYYFPQDTPWTVQWFRPVLFIQIHSDEQFYETDSGERGRPDDGEGPAASVDVVLSSNKEEKRPHFGSEGIREHRTPVGAVLPISWNFPGSPGTCPLSFPEIEQSLP